jgi:uncharacterized OB-fold protein
MTWTTDGATRALSPLGDRRERPVPCADCGRPTVAIDAMCDRCSERAVSAR